MYGQISLLFSVVELLLIIFYRLRAQQLEHQEVHQRRLHQAVQCQWTLPNNHSSLALILRASRGTYLSKPGASSSSSNALVPLNESVEEILTPKKAQMRQEINQLRHDMQWNLHAAQTFARENELHTGAEAEAVLWEQAKTF